MKSRKKTKKKSKRAFSRLLRYILVILIVLPLGWLMVIDYQLISRFEQRHLSAPTHVYSQPVEWFSGSPVSVKTATNTLTALGYRRQNSAAVPGHFAISNNTLSLYRRKFDAASGSTSQQQFKIKFSKYKIERIEDVTSTRVSRIRLDPVVIGTVQSRQQQDRKPVRLHNVPDLLLQTLLLMEDRHFSTHLGVDPWAIMRAVVSNLKSGRVTQGGSTITQQLVKNLFLSPERSLRRKLVEALYAILLEIHFDKHEILEAYVNEVFLAQAGMRAIHGFALASEFFFGRSLEQLEIQDLALLVGMVKAPSSYNPRRNPKRATERRSVVLSVLAEQGVIDSGQLVALQNSPLGVVRRGEGSSRPYGAFLDLVRRQISDRIGTQSSELEQLRVWSTLDMSIQRTVEQQLKSGLEHLEKTRKIKSGTLQGAVVVQRAENGQVVAVTGDRRVGYLGFNRALDAKRPVGSLLKPVIAATALSAQGGYHLNSKIDDSTLNYKLDNGRYWAPQNYDKKNHGEVPLIDVVAKSYNIAAARLGLSVGLNNFVNYLGSIVDLDIDRIYPSALLGSLELSPLDVSRIYSTLASGGLNFPARSFTKITDNQQRTLFNFPSHAKRVLNSDTHFLVNTLLHEVVRNGTATANLGTFGTSYKLSGKTGTTDDYRDSWFAGYAGNYTIVVWIGFDDNRSTKLSGASGALVVWREIAKRLPLRPVNFEQPENIVFRRVKNGATASCESSRVLPFVKGIEPKNASLCQANGEDGSNENTSLFGRFLNKILRRAPKDRNHNVPPSSEKNK